MFNANRRPVFKILIFGQGWATQMVPRHQSPIASDDLQITPCSAAESRGQTLTIQAYRNTMYNEKICSP